MSILLTIALALARPNFAVVPGVSVGQVKLNLVVPNSLGTPTYSDGAAGSVWSTWKAPDGNTLDTFAQLDMAGSGHVVHYARVTSPTFKTANGLHTGSTWHSIKAGFPSVRFSVYSSKQFSRKLAIMDDRAKGITFELTLDRTGRVTNASKCLAIWVHAKGAMFGPTGWVEYQSSRP